MRLLPALAALAMCWGFLVGPASAAPAADVAASEGCVECHDDEDLPDMRRSAHAQQADARTPACTQCHGPSPTHAKKPEGVSKRPAPDIVYSRSGGSSAHARNTACLSCHDRDSRRTLWGGSAHEGADLACSSCHKVHANRDPVLVRATLVDNCYSCHKAQRVQAQRPSRHPVPEGSMGCADCHNVHGSMGPKLLARDSTNDTCYGCHAEKRGPFVHEHEPVSQDCATCHEPHGSTVPAMLKARPPMLCQQCHTPHVAGGVGAVGGQPGVFTPARPGHPAAVGALTGGKNVVNLWQGRSCMNCHTQVHGSNNPSTTGPTPQWQFR